MNIVRFFCIASLACLLVSYTTVASAASARDARKAARKNPARATAFASVCTKVTPLKKALLKNNAGGHIPPSDQRYSGFAFVCGKECAKKFPVKAYYSDGTLAFRLGYYGRWSGNKQPRAYCAAGGVPKCYVSKVKAESKKKGRDGKVYLDFGSKSCRSATPGIRNGTPL